MAGKQLLRAIGPIVRCQLFAFAYPSARTKIEAVCGVQVRSRRMVHVSRQAYDVGPGRRNMHLSIGGYEQRSEQARQTRRQCVKFLIGDANIPSSTPIRRECLKRVLALRDISDGIDAYPMD